MKRLLLFGVAFSLTATLFSERFYSEDEVAEEMIAEFHVSISEITDELKILNDKQIRIIELLSRLSIIADHHCVSSWTNHPVVTTSKE